MPKIPESAVKESYFLRSTFTYNRLRSEGYFDLFLKIRKFSRIEGGNLNWDSRSAWGVAEDAWRVIESKNISPVLVFLHPKVLQLNPSFLKYYRSVALLPQKGMKNMSGVSNVDRIEAGMVEAGRLSQNSVNKLTVLINETVSMIISLASDINERRIEGMMYATAGSKIDGSWRNQIGREGERVIRQIVFNELLSKHEISSVENRKGELTKGDKWKIDDDVDQIKTLNMINGCSILFSSEPDITMFDKNGGILGVVEIKSGLDPAGALERLGAMLKSFENTLAEYPSAVTILVASCITEEAENRLGASMLVRQKYITTSVTASEADKRKFVNRLRAIMQLTRQ